MSKFKKPFERLSNVDECRVIQVIEVKSLVGGGEGGSPMRQITEYFDLDGNRLARVDKYIDDSLNDLGVWDGKLDGKLAVGTDVGKHTEPVEIG